MGIDDAPARVRALSSENERRWREAVSREQSAGAAVCDGDPLKLWYTWASWQEGLVPFAEWQMASGLARAAFARERLGLADLVLYSDPGAAELRRRKDADPSRARHGFETNVGLREAQRRWFEAIDSLDGGRVAWEHPRSGLADTRIGRSARATRSGDALFVALLGALHRRSMPRPPVDETAWFGVTQRILEDGYLGTGDPAAQSGMTGGVERYERTRRVIANAIERDGSFLDIGCANGLLIESLGRWTTHAVEPFGLDISAPIAKLAAERLPHWANRIFVGNALTWQAPRRFDHVLTELVYVPEHRAEEYVARLLADIVAPNGRLIVTSYGSRSRPDLPVQPLVRMLSDWGHGVAGSAEVVEEGRVVVSVAWIDRSG